MKKSKKVLVNIRKFMECYLEEPYERTLSRKQKRAMEELDVKEKLGIPMSKKDKKKLKKITKFVLTHKGMMGYLCEHNLPIPKRVSFEEAERQAYDGERYIYVIDETGRVIPYKNPKLFKEKSLEEEAFSMTRTNQTLRNRKRTAESMTVEYRNNGDKENYAMYMNVLIDARNRLYQIYLETQVKNNEFQDDDFEDYDGPIEKNNRNAKHDKIYSYGRRK